MNPHEIQDVVRLSQNVMPDGRGLVYFPARTCRQQQQRHCRKMDLTPCARKPLLQSETDTA